MNQKHTHSPARSVLTVRLAVSAAVMLVSNGTLTAAEPMTTPTFQSGENRTSLLELYASEGCNSCPPAETWLSQQTNANGLWASFVPVAFHVDYWDHLGWRDRWGQPQFSDRQRAYAELFRSRTIYTPEFILNGREWRSWTEAKQVPRIEQTVGVLKVSLIESNRWLARFAPRVSGKTYIFHVAQLACGLSSDVKAGENSGRHLEHDFVALTLVSGRLDKKDNAFEATFTLALTNQPVNTRAALAVWVTRGAELEAVQATGGWLSPRQ